MKPHKWRALNRVLKRGKQDIQMYIDAMRELEEKARACYQGPISLNSNEFTEMLLLDGCFVLELFKGTVEGFREIGYACNDPVFAMGGLMHSIQRDMVMLENQLPMFILDRLLELQLGTQNQTGIVADLAVKFLNPLRPTGVGLHNPDDKGELHCLDVFRRSLLRSSTTLNPKCTLERLSWNYTRVVDKRQQQLVPSMTELRKASVKFRRKTTDRFWDIEFKDGYLLIPTILIHDGTKSLFSNLIAFEQCHNDSSNHITSYIMFMGNLINSDEDVSYLHFLGIIKHWLGSDSEVADLFNGLCKEVGFHLEDSHLCLLSHDVYHFCNLKWRVFKAVVIHNHLSYYLACYSFSAGVILLILTLSQTFYTVYAYYKPSS